MPLSKFAVALVGGWFMIGVTVTGGTPSAQCKGNACRDVLFEIDSGCSTATNLGGKTVVVEWGGYELKLSAGGSKSIRKDGRCVEQVDGPISANFA